MALPVAPPPRSNDTAVLGWAGLTVRVAWTLLSLGVKVRPEVLREARAHVLHHLDPATPLPHAEDHATWRVEEFVARARGRRPDDPFPQDWEMPVSPRWRRALDRALDPLAEAVFKKHYGDNRGLERLETSLDVDRVSIEAIRAGLREVVRKAAVTDGLPLDGWPPERIDRLLRRLAAWSPGPCPPVLDVAHGSYREHTATCARCDRLSRLVRSSVLEVDDLFPPTVGARPSGRASVLAVHFHPDARRARRKVVEELGVPCFPLGDDLLLLDGTHAARAHEVLTVAAEVGAPPREQLRAALLEGPGAWTPRGLLGPLPERAAREVLHRSWGTVEGLGELPAELPRPPSARRWWGAVAATGLAGALLLGTAFARGGAPDDPLDVAFDGGRGGTWAVFDVAEPAVVTLVALRGGALEVVHAGRSAADKAELATGDGRYRVHVPGDGVVLVASSKELPDLEARLAAARAADDDPLRALAADLAADGASRWFRR